ncbi:MAG: J domain-containing protein [Candidatus Limnocylindrales bacterium]
MDDLYKKLQVDPTAEPEVIRAAYYALARKYHPDKGGDAQRMVDFNAAWAVLGNTSLRAAYDIERARSATTPAAADPAGPLGHNAPAQTGWPTPSRSDSSTVLDFGRYAGWSLAQLVKSDPDYLQWLMRTPIGRRLAAEVKALLEVRAASSAAVGVGHRGAPIGGPIGARRGRASIGWQWFGRATQGR